MPRPWLHEPLILNRPPSRGNSMNIKSSSVGVAMMAVTAVIAIAIARSSAPESDRMTVQFSEATPTDDKFLSVGERNTSNIMPVSEQIRFADYVSLIRISHVEPTRFNTVTGLRPENERDAFGMLIGTPLVADVIENYQIPAGVSAPNGWALLMLGGVTDEVIQHSSGYTGESIKSIGATGVAFISVLDDQSGELATPENVEPLMKSVLDIGNDRSSALGVNYGKGIVYNWYLLENGQATSYHDNRTLPESDLIQEIQSGLQ